MKRNIENENKRQLQGEKEANKIIAENNMLKNKVLPFTKWKGYYGYIITNKNKIKRVIVSRMIAIYNYRTNETKYKIIIYIGQKKYNLDIRCINNWLFIKRKQAEERLKEFRNDKNNNSLEKLDVNEFVNEI